MRLAPLSASVPAQVAYRGSESMSEVFDQLPRVAKVIDEYRVVINRGADDGVRPGRKYVLFSIGEEVSDPDSGVSLGRLEILKGLGEVIHVQSKMATLRSAEKVRVPQKVRKIRSLYGLIQPPIEEVEPDLVVDKEFDEPSVGDFAKPV